MSDIKACSHQLVYQIADRAARCEYIRKFCDDNYESIDFTEFSYCTAKENYWVIIPFYVDISKLSASDTGADHQTARIRVG